MRTLVEPPPSSRCDLCGGELRLKLIEPANRELDLEDEILVCVNCGHEQSNIVKHNHNMPTPRRPSLTITFSAPRPSISVALLPRTGRSWRKGEGVVWCLRRITHG